MCNRDYHVDLLVHMLVWPSGEGRSVGFLVPCSVTCGVSLGRNYA